MDTKLKNLMKEKGIKIEEVSEADESGEEYSQVDDETVEGDEGLGLNKLGLMKS